MPTKDKKRPQAKDKSQKQDRSSKTRAKARRNRSKQKHMKKHAKTPPEMQLPLTKCILYPNECTLSPVPKQAHFSPPCEKVANSP